jgi:hypothetical protein
MRTFEDFWDDIWGAALIVAIVGIVGWCFYAFFLWEYQSTRNYQHDLFYALSGRPDSVATYESTTGAALELLRFVGAENVPQTPSEMSLQPDSSASTPDSAQLKQEGAPLDSLMKSIVLPDSATVIRRLSYLIFLKDNRLHNFDAGLAYRDSLLAFFENIKRSDSLWRTSLVSSYIKLYTYNGKEPGDGWNMNKRLFEEVEKDAVRLYLAMTKTLPVKEIPATMTHSPFDWYYLLIWWLVFTIVTILRHVYVCYDNRLKFYDIPWGKLPTYIVIALWLPGVLVWITPWAICRLIRFLFTYDFSHLGQDLSKLFKRGKELAQKVGGQHNLVNQTAAPIFRPVTEVKADKSEVAPKVVPDKPEERPAVWYFVDKLPDGSRARLNQAGIVVAPAQITVNGQTKDGLTFPEEEWQRVFNTLDIKPVNVKKVPTDTTNVIYYVYDDPQGWLKEKRDKFLQQKENHKQRFIAECQTGVRNRIEAKRDEIKSAQQTLSDASRKIVEGTRKIEYLGREITAMEGMLAADKYSTDKLVDDFEKLCSMAHVVAVEVQSGYIRVYTDAVIIPYQGKRYKLGEFEITIKTGENVTYKNIFNRRNGVDHPYGNCLGNLAEGISKLIAENDFVHVVQVMLEFLRSVHEGYEMNLQYWEVIDDQFVAQETGNQNH